MTDTATPKRCIQEPREESDHFVHMLIRGENKLHRLDGIPAWAYDSQGNLIP